MYGFKFLYEIISKVSFEISHKIVNQYPAKYKPLLTFYFCVWFMIHFSRDVINLSETGLYGAWPSGNVSVFNARKLKNVKQTSQSSNEQKISVEDSFLDSNVTVIQVELATACIPTQYV